jgi:hypothetical protein
MKKYFIILFLILFAFSCKNEEKKKGIIEPSKMVEVMTDVHLAEALLKDMKNNGIKADSFANIYYSEIFIKHKITRKQLDENISYYASKPLELGKIYDSIIAKISKLEDTKKL